MYFFNVFSLWLIILTHDYDSLYFFCLFIFIGHYWLKSIFIGETNICVYLKITSSASPFNNPIYESFYMTHMIFIACSRSSTLLCAYAECLKSRIFASFITPVTFYLFSSWFIIMIHLYDSYLWLTIEWNCFHYFVLLKTEPRTLRRHQAFVWPKIKSIFAHPSFSLGSPFQQIKTAIHFQR